MNNLNNAILTNYLNGLDVTGWQAFATDLESNVLNAFQSRFSLTPRWISVLTQLGPQMQSEFVNVANSAVSGLQSGALVCTFGIAFDANPTGPATVTDPFHGTGTVSVSIDPKTGKVVIDPGITITINF
jgi:hypothetical protein